MTDEKGDGQSGLRTEMVTLEVTHSEDDRLGSASSWEWQTIADATIGQHAESAVDVRVVQEGCLTDAERSDLQTWLAECLRQCSTATEGGDEELASRWQGRATRAAAMLERLGGGR